MERGGIRTRVRRRASNGVAVSGPRCCRIAETSGVGKRSKRVSFLPWRHVRKKARCELLKAIAYPAREELRSASKESADETDEEQRADGTRVRVERGSYRPANGRYAICVMSRGRPSFRTVAGELKRARLEGELWNEAARKERGSSPDSPHRCIGTSTLLAGVIGPISPRPPVLPARLRHHLDTTIAAAAPSGGANRLVVRSTGG